MAMQVLAKLQDDMKQAMKSGDAVSRDTLRMLIANLKQKELELKRELDAAEELAVLQKALKTREESVTQYDAAGRLDLVAKEKAEIAVVQRYLPAMLSEDETRTLVRATIQKLGISSKKDVGQLMKTLMAEHKGKIDGKLVQRVAGELLA